MFNFFKKEKNSTDTQDTVFAPVDGDVQDISRSSDPVFAAKTMGNGFAIIPTSGKLFAPVNGQVTLVANTKHALTIQTVDGADVLLHFGIDTVNLFGKPFDLKVQKGDQVKAKSVLGSMDISQIKSAGLSAEVLVIFVKSEGKDTTVKSVGSNKKHGDLIGRYTINKEK
ncbi:PTS sugar transporter subunit IIA [Oenococcus oeni]|uniref:PTS sugar transporter subunit IIA n=1 Tax=Oenococcus oeni TaxID=1247 RepID=UPI0010B481D3|nr:PTS glucose transporter subunit IIA [Oenococcus oeni]SYW15669.1 PTS system, glucose/sucrose specific IIA subunit [Oenococcus oeni]